MTPEEQAVIDAAIEWYAQNYDMRHDRVEWALVQAIEALPDATITPLYG